MNPYREIVETRQARDAALANGDDLAYVRLDARHAHLMRHLAEFGMYATKFNPSLHPRDRAGKFQELLGQLSHAWGPEAASGAGTSVVNVGDFQVERGGLPGRPRYTLKRKGQKLGRFKSPEDVTKRINTEAPDLLKDPAARR